MKSQAAVDQVVTVIAEVPGGKVKLEFEKKGELLVSKTPLPEGDKYTIVVQVKTSAEAKPKNFRGRFYHGLLPAEENARRSMSHAEISFAESKSRAVGSRPHCSRTSCMMVPKSRLFHSPRPPWRSLIFKTCLR